MKGTKEIVRYRKGKGIKSPSPHMPTTLLKLKGKLDAKKTPSVADSYIKKICSNTDGLTNKEILRAEKILYPFREEAATIIASLSTATASLESAPDISNGSSAVDKRTDKRVSAIRNGYISSIRSGNSRISAINEMLVSISTALQERIDKTHKKSMAKIYAYQEGLHKGGLSDYTPTIEYDDHAFAQYKENHIKLDEKIARLSNGEKEEI